MLSINLQRIFKLRGIDKPYTFLISKGFVPATASKWARNDVGYIRAAQIGKLCVALNCTPNDLFHWTPDKKTSLPDTHALTKLVHTEPAQDVRQLVSELPADKLAQLGEIIAELKK